MKRFFWIFACLISTIALEAQDVVKWSYDLKDNDTDHPVLQITANIEQGYHLYSFDNPPGGGIPLQFFFDTKGCKLEGQPMANKDYVKSYNEIFEVNEHLYDGTVTFTQKIIPTEKDYSIDLEIKGQACNDMGCMQVFGSHSFKGKAPVTNQVIPQQSNSEHPSKEPLHERAELLAEMTDSLQESEPFMTPAANLSGVSAHENWWENVEAEMMVFSDAPSHLIYKSNKNDSDI